MSRILPLIALSCLGCGPHAFVEPALDEPHAEVTVRIIHHEVSGRQLRHRTMVGQFELATRMSAAGPSTPVTRTVRVPPVETPWRFTSRFFHTETQMRTVYETEQYACGTQSTGYGRSQRTTTRYCSRQVPRQRWTSVDVTDGVCEATTTHHPIAGRRYVLQFDYHANGHCRARCFERLATGDGQFQLAPCRGAPTAGGYTSATSGDAPAPTCRFQCPSGWTCHPEGCLPECSPACSGGMSCNEQRRCAPGRPLRPVDPTEPSQEWHPPDEGQPDPGVEPSDEEIPEEFREATESSLGPRERSGHGPLEGDDAR